jgi:sulfate adenylyltransferase
LVSAPHGRRLVQVTAVNRNSDSPSGFGAKLKVKLSKEAMMHAMLRKNSGCTHIMIGRDHAGVGSFYGPYAAQEILNELPDLGTSPLYFSEFYYSKECAGITSQKTCPHGEADKLSFSGTKLRKMLSEGETPPSEFMRPEVSEVMLKAKAAFVE